MTATLNRLGSGREAGLYYTNGSQREAKPRNRDEYYARDGDGTWWSSGETVVRHDAPIDLASFRDLCAGYDPRTGEGLVRGAGANHWAGVDLTLTIGKSASVLWTAGTPEQRAIIEAAHREAVNEALRFAVREGLIVVRSGAGGKHRDRPTDLIVGRFYHFTTREGDPNIHTHCVVMNVAGSAHGGDRYRNQHLTIEPKRLFDWMKGVGAAYRSAAAERLARHGFIFRPAGQGQWEIVGIPQSTIEAFSKRSHQIEAMVGRDASAAQKEIAALVTRSSKDTVPSGPELEARWQQELAEQGLDPWVQALEPERERQQAPLRNQEKEHSRDLDPPELPGTSPVAIAASALFRHESVITRAALLERALVEASLQGIGIAPVYAEIAQLEESGGLLRLGERTPDAQIWTTPAIAKAEAAMLQAANRPAERTWFSHEAVEAALKAAPHLAPEQQEVVRAVASQDGISIIEAGAGTGKTTAAKAIRDAADRSGLRVVGLSPSWVAANELGQSIGVPAQAIAKWRSGREHGSAPALDPGTVLLVDEAGMASMRDIAAIVTAAREAGAKVILMGDSRQLESVPGGSALRAITEVVRQNAVMEVVRRQEVDWQRAASVVMARGDAEAGLRAYAERGHVEMVSGTKAAMERVLDQWQKLRTQHGDDVLIITRRNADASTLNRSARAILRQEGKLSGDDVVLPAVDREKKVTMLSLAVGDRVRFGETLPDLQIWNGTRGTLLAVRDPTVQNPVLCFRLEDGRVIEQPWQAFTRRMPRRAAGLPRMVHAYAGTAYSVQGRTAAASVHYVGSATDSRETYLALTRHRRDVRIIVERDRLDAACRIRQADARLNPTQVDFDERLFREASQYGEKANVVDYVADRQDFITTGIVTRPDLRPRRSIPRLMQAARALRSAMQILAETELVLPAWRLVENGVRLLTPMPDMLRGAISRARENRSLKHHQESNRSHGPER